MPASTLSLLLLLAQLTLLALTAVIVPLKLPVRFLAFLLYTVLAGVLWFGYALAAMVFDGTVGNDVPGAGYLFIGFLAWVVGVIIIAVRNSRGRAEPMPGTVADKPRSSG